MTWTPTSRHHPAAPRPGWPRRQHQEWGQLRVTQVERDQVAEHLQAAFADGRLDDSEFNSRLELAMTARTRRDLDALLTDLTVPSAPRVPQPRPVTLGERTGALCAHLSGLGASVFGPLLVLLVNGGRSPFVRSQAMDALNFQLTFLLACTGLIFVTVVTLGLAALAYIPLALGWLVLPLVGAATSAGGEAYRYPLTIRLAR